MLTALYPDHKWETSRFQQRQESIESEKAALSAVARELNINLLSDWYNVPVAAVLKHQQGIIVSIFISIHNSLHSF